MINIRCYALHPDGHAAYVRIQETLAALRRRGFGISIEHIDPDDFRFRDLTTCDIVWFNRIFNNPHVMQVASAKRAGCKVWVDWDDDVKHVPEHNIAHKDFLVEGLDLDRNLRLISQMADVITTTTKFLAEDIFNYKPEKTVLLPNAIADEDMDRWIMSSSNKVVVWRGSDTHVKDLEHFAPQLREFAEGEWKMHFMGMDPGYLQLPTDSYTWDKERVYTEYIKKLYKIAAPIHIVPLYDEPFNRAKSNLAYLEATAAGSVTIAPDWDEWRKPGVLNYRSEDHFLEVLRRAAADPTLCQENAEKAQEYVRENQTVSKINDIEEKIIKWLMS